MPTRRVLVQVSRRFWNWATPALYRSVVITHPRTINLLFASIMERGERSLLFRPGVRRFHLSIPYQHQEYWRDVVPGTEELMQYLPNLKIFCAAGWLHPKKPLLFTPLDPSTSFPYLEAVEHSQHYHISTVRESILNLLHSSPNLRLFLVPYYQDTKPDVYAFKYLRGCYVGTLINTNPSDSSIGPNLEDTIKQTLSSQTPFPRLRSLYFWETGYPKSNQNLTHHITLLDLTPIQWMGTTNVIDLSQFPQLRTLVIPFFPKTWWQFKFLGDSDELREVGVRSGKRPSPDLRRDFQALVELVLGLPATIQRFRLLGFGLCRALAKLGLHQSALLTWRAQLEERSISLEGPNGLPLVEFLASLSLSQYQSPRQFVP
jgi:hypothetical protein